MKIKIKESNLEIELEEDKFIVKDIKKLIKNMKKAQKVKEKKEKECF